MIYYFTGTGNSRYIARELHQQLNEDYINMNTLIRNDDHSLQNIQGTCQDCEAGCFVAQQFESLFKE